MYKCLSYYSYRQTSHIDIERKEPVKIFTSICSKYSHKASGAIFLPHLCPHQNPKEDKQMTYLTNYFPTLIGLTLVWFVALGMRELIKEASIVMKKSNA